MHLKKRIKRNSLNCSVYIWVLSDSDSSWSASPQKTTDVEQVMYSQWTFLVIGTSVFTCIFQHTRLSFSPLYIWLIPYMYYRLSFIFLILSCHFRDNLFSFRNNLWFSMYCNKHDEISYKVSFPVGCWTFYSFQPAQFMQDRQSVKKRWTENPLDANEKPSLEIWT